jgi:hypothetical protein
MRINHEETDGAEGRSEKAFGAVRFFVVDSLRRARHTSCRFEIPIVTVQKEKCKTENDKGDVWQSRPTQLARA